LAWSNCFSSNNPSGFLTRSLLCYHVDMPNLPGAFSDSFEMLGDAVKQAGSQLVQVPKDILETGAKQVKGQTASDTATQKSGDQGIEQPITPAIQGQKKVVAGQKLGRPSLTLEQQLELKAREDKQRSMARYRQIQEEIQRYRAKKTQETPAYIAGKPGMPKDEAERVAMWQQQEEQKKAEKKEKILLPGQQGGTKGVGERLKGVSG
jgi:hypothetical protein